MHLFKIEGKEYLATEYKVGKDQTWKPGSGRDAVDGNWYGTILGFYTNLKMTLVMENATQLQNFISDTRKSAISISYYDPETISNITRLYYIANYEIAIEGFYDGGSEQFFDTISVEFVVHKKD